VAAPDPAGGAGQNNDRSYGAWALGALGAASASVGAYLNGYMSTSTQDHSTDQTDSPDPQNLSDEVRNYENSGGGKKGVGVKPDNSSKGGECESDTDSSSDSGDSGSDSGDYDDYTSDEFSSDDMTDIDNDDETDGGSEGSGNGDYEDGTDTEGDDDEDDTDREEDDNENDESAGGHIDGGGENPTFPPNPESSPSPKISEQTKEYIDRGSVVLPIYLFAENQIKSHLSQIDEFFLPAAGEKDPNYIYRPWISGNLGSISQDYKGDLGSFGLGSDFMLSDSLKLGIAYLNITGKFKYNEVASSVKSNVFQIYGQYDITPELFVQSALSHINSKVSDEKAKYRSKGFGAFSLLNYKISLSEDISLIPHMGLRYVQSKDGDRSFIVDEGLVEQKGQKNKILAGIIGSKLEITKHLKDLYFAYGFSAGLSKDIFNKGQGSKATLLDANGVEVDNYQGKKLGRTVVYNLGLNTALKNSRIELSLNYNFAFGHKYKTHQGNIKLQLKL